MRFLASILIALLLAAASWSIVPQNRVAVAQSAVSVIGPVTPGDCTSFFSQTQLQDAGVAGCFGPGNLTVSAPIIESVAGSNVRIGFAPCGTPVSGQVVYYTAAWGCAYITLTGDVSSNNLYTSTVVGLQGQPVLCKTPVSGQVLQFTNAWGCGNTGVGTVTEAKITAGTGISTSGNCDWTTSNAGSPCNIVNAGVTSVVAGTAAVSGTCTGTCAHVSQTAPASCAPTDGSGATLTFTGVSCEWTQIGNIVFLNFALTYPSTANGASTQINGLPVTVPNAGYGNVPCSAFAGVGDSAVFLLAVNTTHGNFLNGSSGAAITNGSFSTTTVRVSCQYPAS